MKNEYRIFGFARRFPSRYDSVMQKEKERTSRKDYLLSLPVSCGVDTGHLLNR